MTIVSFMSANLVGRELGWHGIGSWAQAQDAVEEAFRPLATFADRFDALLSEVEALGFDGVDVWVGHLHWRWATRDHAELARGLVERHGLRVASLAGGFGSTPAEVEAACRLAAALGTDILGGRMPLLQQDRRTALAALERHDVRLAVETHGDRSIADLLELVGGGEGGRLGVTADTGWLATDGYDVPTVLDELGRRVIHVHLKDVVARGSHLTCALGEGIVPIEPTLAALDRIGYTGALSVEHEPLGSDPRDECARSLERVRRSLGVA